jgi:hypothetical protein
MKLRIGLAPFIAGSAIALLAICWAGTRSYRSAFLAPRDGLKLPGGLGLGGRPIGHAHQGWLAIRAFEQYMDSLRADSAGVMKYDSILRQWPGVMDSAKVAERFFYLQDHLNK